MLILIPLYFVVVQSLRQVRLFVTLYWTAVLDFVLDCNTPGFPVLHYLLELAQTNINWVSDAIYIYTQNWDC